MTRKLLPHERKPKRNSELRKISKPRREPKPVVLAADDDDAIDTDYSTKNASSSDRLLERLRAEDNRRADGPRGSCESIA